MAAVSSERISFDRSSCSGIHLARLSSTPASFLVRPIPSTLDRSFSFLSPAMPYLDDISRCIQSSLATSDSLTSGGSFATSGSFSPLPLHSGLTVSGVGSLAFPLLPAQCRSLISVAAPSPFGQGTRTLLNPTVRKSWQIDAAAITLDAAWEECLLQTILPRVCAELGLAWDASASTTSFSSITYTARLYKLLIYEQGGIFAPHRDSEKEDGMFGTLVVVLPSQYTGGVLVVEHAGQTKAIDLSEGEGWRSWAYAAFYADCLHRVEKVTSGYRVALTFNLCTSPRGEGEQNDAGEVMEQEESTVVEPEDYDANEGTGWEETSGDRHSPPLVPALFPSAKVITAYSGVVHDLCTALTHWSEDLNGHAALVFPLAH